MKNRLFILFLVLALLLIGCKAEASTELHLSDFDLSGTDQIRLQNAHNGHFTILSKPEDIAEITAFVQDVVGTDPESGKGYYEGTYSVAFYRNEENIFSFAFGDSDCFYTGKGSDGYPIRYLLKDITIRDDVIPFLSQFDQSGFKWN
jgi:hypothetical protein